MDIESNVGENGARGPLKTPILGRARLARLVVVGSFLTLFLLAGVLVSFANHGNGAEAAEKAFNSILPVLAGWVGTVLAFYFSSASQDSANNILDRTIQRSSRTLPPSDELVSSKMIPSPAIVGTRNLKKNPPESIALSTLRQDFAGKLPNGAAVTRLFFLEDGVFKYVLHSSTLNAFIADADPAVLQGASFADLLKNPDIVDQISKLVVFVSTTATVGAAKNALDRVAGAQDVIVTPTGNATEQMLGWMSNVDLTKALTVN